MSPWFLVSFLYLAAAALMAADASLASFDIVGSVDGLRWLRVHLITLGAVAQALFGALPVLATIRSGRVRPGTRWDIWLLLNAGLLTLLVGIPSVEPAFILAGGTLVFAAAVLLTGQLVALRNGPVSTPTRSGRPFYVVGVSFLLLGIIIGTGLWLGWSQTLRIAVPLEVHIHAQNWGFLSLVFAGLLVDLYPRFSGQALAWPRSVTPILVMMTIGAAGLVAGPWLGSNPVSVPGLILHLSATIWLLANVIAPVLGDRSAWTTPGMWHLVTSYVWILAPVLVAPLIIAGVAGFPGAGIEANAPQALIYGWVLQFAYAVLPYLFARAFLPDGPAALGGSWTSLVAVHAGAVVLWVGIFATAQRATLHGLAYALWAVSAVPILLQIWRIVRRGLADLDTRTTPLPDPTTSTVERSTDSPGAPAGHERALPDRRPAR
jgi:cytochrome c oxidase cbb3-type subunit 1